LYAYYLLLHNVSDVEKIISESRDYEELKYVWSQWRDASGAKMRTNYQNYVTYSNQAAEANGINFAFLLNESDINFDFTKRLR
jgi:peptidyl-dipeptidase A